MYLVWASILLMLLYLMLYWIEINDYSKKYQYVQSRHYLIEFAGILYNKTTVNKFLWGTYCTDFFIQKLQALQLMPIQLSNMSSLNLNLHSHRRYIKEKTNQFVPYHRLAPKKSTKSLKKRTQTTQIDNDQDQETSIVIDNMNDGHDKQVASKENVNIFKNPYSRHFKSEQNLLKRKNAKRNIFEKIKSANLVDSREQGHKNFFSVKKLSHNVSSSKSRNCGSEQSIQKKLEEEVKQPILKKSIKQFNPLKICSENNLRNTLKKSSCSKLKLKVKDPFQRKRKLEHQFKDESDIFKGDQSFLSTLNKEQFKQILSQLDF